LDCGNNAISKEFERGHMTSALASEAPRGNWVTQHKAKLKALGLSDSPILQRERERRRANNIKRSKPGGIKRRKFVDDIKMSRGCADCGYAEHPAALDFDHLPGFTKTAAISELRRRWSASIATLEAEIAKCDVVCANCHRIRTAKRKHWLSSPKIMVGRRPQVSPPPTQSEVDAWQAATGWCRMKRCSKCSQVGHNVRACPHGSDSIRGMLQRSLMSGAKTLDEIVVETKLKRSAANITLCAMAKKGITRKVSRKRDGRWELNTDAVGQNKVTSEQAGAMAQ